MNCADNRHYDATLDALRLPCPTCADIRKVDPDYADDHCPDCSDGLMSHEWAWRIVAAVVERAASVLNAQGQSAHDWCDDILRGVR